MAAIFGPAGANMGAARTESGVEPHAWLRDASTRKTNSHPMAEIDNRLPWNWRARLHLCFLMVRRRPFFTA